MLLECFRNASGMTLKGLWNNFGPRIFICTKRSFEHRVKYEGRGTCTIYVLVQFFLKVYSACNFTIVKVILEEPLRDEFNIGSPVLFISPYLTFADVLLHKISRVLFSPSFSVRNSTKRGLITTEVRSLK